MILEPGYIYAWYCDCAVSSRKIRPGSKSDCSDARSVLNLARVKLRDQQRLDAGPLKEYSQYGEGVPFGDATPRAGNDPAVVSPAVFCGARAGSKILTHTPISLFKQLFGKKFVILLVNQTGKLKRDMPSRRNALTS